MSSATSELAVDDDALTEILLRLPVKSVLRCRAVSKRWRRVGSSPGLVSAYSRIGRPLEVLVYPDGFKAVPAGAQNVLAGLDPLLPSGDVRRFLRYDRHWQLVDSRDGLLVLALLGQQSFLLCNPATRRWASLPALTPEPCFCVVAAGLYFHRPSGEHRLLVMGSHRHRYQPDSRSYGPPRWYYVLSSQEQHARMLGPVAGEGNSGFTPSACLAIGDTLHWSRHPEAGDTGSMVAFDTASETFRLIAPPISLHDGRRRHVRQFDMDGTLAVSAVAEEGSPPRRMDVWAVQGKSKNHRPEEYSWSHRLRVDLPPRLLPPPGSFQYPANDEAVAVVDGVLVVVGSGWVLLYDIHKGKIRSMLDHSGDIGNVTRCLYRETLVPLPEPLPFCGGTEGELSVRHCPPDDPYMSLYGSHCGHWVTHRL